MGIYRPPQWTAPAMVSISVTQQSTSPADSGGDATSITNGVPTFTASTTAQTTYIFDAVLSLEHDQRIKKTEHPVQTGSDFSSHAFLLPARVVLYILMSDAVDAYSSGADPAKSPYINPWSGNPSKSVSAYQTLLKLQASFQPITLTTRLRTYTGMLIDGISPREDFKTIHGLRARVEFGQIRTASIVSTPNSARVNDTQSTGLGAVNAQSPNQTTLNQYSVPSTTPSTSTGSNLSTFTQNNPGGVQIPGAGSFSSVPTSSLANLPSPQ